MKFDRDTAIAVTALIGALILFGVMLYLPAAGRYIAGTIAAIHMLCCAFVAAGTLGGMEQ